ncbi:16S rRNA (cytidine(1402)-2'-O)-methyltransferase [Patescibacteria group bacterium]|nr:16S rRNA (cytidine(1402)-2'-O)-methyltransferase [Patescibacteria group bacterium]MBU1721459.1 16S rRNA (cytidine(1402)-2'-O)-methyltransferase [Patescibacteria group bacterium]MBU1900784.1 16S rRNA (cytidine(1402)-2'-O)-methyltransferase [Patescibacteria group bacterium]
MAENDIKGQLHIVATPIGNLADITIRALDTLRSVDLILCEDTRVTKRLLDAYEIETKTMSYHQHSTETKVGEIIALLQEGMHLALVTDAGTPGISDPGNMLISAVNQQTDIIVSPIPGASAIVAALSISGFPTDKFLFLGFPPHKNKRNKFFKEVAEAQYTVAFYESCHRIDKALLQLQEVLPKGSLVCVCRELTKKFEQIARGTIDEILNIKTPAKGEFVLLVYNKKK